MLCITRTLRLHTVFTLSQVEVAGLAKQAEAEQMDENINTLMRGVQSGQMGEDMENIKQMMENTH